MTGAPRLRPSPSAALFSARAISTTPKELTSARYSPGTRVAVGAQQRERMVAGVHQRQAEALDQRGVDVGDEVAEVIDGDDDAGDAARLDARLIDPGGHQRSHLLAQVRRVQCPAASSAATGAMMSRPWKVALGLWMPRCASCAMPDAR